VSTINDASAIDKTKSKNIPLTILDMAMLAKYLGINNLILLEGIYNLDKPKAKMVITLIDFVGYNTVAFLRQTPLNDARLTLLPPLFDLYKKDGYKVLKTVLESKEYKDYPLLGDCVSFFTAKNVNTILLLFSNFNYDKAVSFITALNEFNVSFPMAVDNLLLFSIKLKGISLMSATQRLLAIPNADKDVAYELLLNHDPSLLLALDKLPVSTAKGLIQKLDSMPKNSLLDLVRGMKNLSANHLASIGNLILHNSPTSILALNRTANNKILHYAVNKALDIVSKNGNSANAVEIIKASPVHISLAVRKTAVKQILTNYKVTNDQKFLGYEKSAELLVNDLNFIYDKWLYGMRRGSPVIHQSVFITASRNALFVMTHHPYTMAAAKIQMDNRYKLA
jgi:hypothetical protein